MLSSVKTQPRMWLLSFDFVLNILQCPHRESYAEKLCEAQVVIFQPEDVLFLPVQRTSQVLETLP